MSNGFHFDNEIETTSNILNGITMQEGGGRKSSVISNGSKKQSLCSRRRFEAPESSLLHLRGSTLSSITPPLTRKESYGSLEDRESKVMVFYTGGTIGMIRNDKGELAPTPNELVRMIRKYPHLHDEEYAQAKYGKAANMAPLVLPAVEGERRRVIFSITEYEPLLDSSNMSMQDWKTIADDIQNSYEFFDGFVILHGTDTLSYTSSALSFMLENLGKPVIATGALIPIFETRSDGRDNFLSALILAGNYNIPEVCVFFGNKLYRGNRTVKQSCESFFAFQSPNFPPLAEMAINVQIDYKLLFRPANIEKFRVHSNLNENVGLLRIFPSITTATVRAFLQPPMEGVVLQTFGSGNIPSVRLDMIEEMKSASQRGLLIVNITQCSEGSVAGIYETGAILEQIGVIPGGDMTPEAALSKLSYVLSKTDWSLDTKRQMMQTNLRGEQTGTRSSKLQDYDLVEAVGRSLHLSSPREVQQLGSILFPAMLNAAVIAKDVKKLETLHGYGADLSAKNYDLRTPLHIACCEGNLTLVQYLLLNGSNVHIKDRYGRTPLQDAIEYDHHAIISLLMKCGAHLSGSTRNVGLQLVSAAERGVVKRIESLKFAGADLTQPDVSGRTAAHGAALHGFVEVLTYLKKQGVSCTETDLMNKTPLDYAQSANQEEAIAFLKEITKK